MTGPPDHDSITLLEVRFVRFLIAGGLAAVCNFGSRFVYSLWANFSTAVVLAFFTGLSVGYLLNKFYVFTSSINSVPKEILWFVLINLLALLQTWGLSVYLVELIPHINGTEATIVPNWTEPVAHLAGILLPVFTSYIGHKYLTFRE